MMNKYQKALDRQKNNVKKLREKEFVEYRDDFATLQELVDKETPKKPIKETLLDAYDCDDRSIDFEWTRTLCPHCKDDLINEYEERDFEDYDYCPCCGGRLDWSDEDEN